MNVVACKKEIDLTQSSKTTVIHAVQGEANTRSLELSLFCGKEPWIVPEGTIVSVRYKRLDLTGGYYDTLSDGRAAYTYKDNLLCVILAPQMLDIPGLVLMQIELLKGTQILSTHSFHIDVKENPAAGIIKSDNYVNWLRWIQEELEKYIASVKESGQFFGGTMAGPINMNGQKLYGLNAPVEADDAATKSFTESQIRKARPRNLLDNSDFTNPVNQRGVSNEGIRNAIFIDRWIFDASKDTGAYSLGSNGITFGAGTWLKQWMPFTQEQMDNKIFTVAIWLADDTVWVQSVLFTANDSYVSAPWAGQGIGTFFNGESWSLVLSNVPDCTIKYVALYEGEYTIETLPNYHPKGYSAELMECKRYFIDIAPDENNHAPAYAGYCTATAAYITIPTGIDMRKGNSPYILNLDMRGIVCNGQFYTMDSYAVIGWKKGYIELALYGRFPDKYPCTAILAMQISNEL